MLLEHWKGIKINNMVYWVLSIFTVSAIVGGLWFWYLYKKGELASDYPYDDEM